MRRNKARHSQYKTCMRQDKDKKITRLDKTSTTTRQGETRHGETRHGESRQSQKCPLLSLAARCVRCFFPSNLAFFLLFCLCPYLAHRAPATERYSVLKCKTRLGKNTTAETQDYQSQDTLFFTQKVQRKHDSQRVH
jgi:hypothetical protein